LVKEDDMTTLAIFIEAIARLGNISHEDAARVADYYIAKKIAKADRHGAGYNVAHGAFLDAEVIQRAVEAARS
jgi:hypothetical protein